MKPATKSTRRRAFLARKIADDLFIDSCGNKADRLVMKSESGSANLGGWCHKAVVTRIKDLLERYKV